MPADPPDVDFLVADDAAGADEELPDPGAPWWLRARIPLGVAAAVALLAAVLFRLPSSGSDHGQPAAGLASNTPTQTQSSGQFPLRRIRRVQGGDSIRVRVNVPCDVLPMCIVAEGAPPLVTTALKKHLPGVRVVIASTSFDRTGIAGRNHHFRDTSLLARWGMARIRLTITRTHGPDQRPTRAGERETADGTHIYARAHLHGYSVSIDVTAPSGRARVHARAILALATDPLLRPAY